jgi:hypothetical protein
MQRLISFGSDREGPKADKACRVSATAWTVVRTVVFVDREIPDGPAIKNQRLRETRGQLTTDRRSIIKTSEKSMLWRDELHQNLLLYGRLYSHSIVPGGFDVMS